MRFGRTGPVGAEVPAVLDGDTSGRPYLRAGDAMELQIDHLGRQRQEAGQA